MHRSLSLSKILLSVLSCRVCLGAWGSLEGFLGRWIAGMASGLGAHLCGRYRGSQGPSRARLTDTQPVPMQPPVGRHDAGIPPLALVTPLVAGLYKHKDRFRWHGFCSSRVRAFSSYSSLIGIKEKRGGETQELFETVSVSSRYASLSALNTSSLESLHSNSHN